jgi:hypothetical protein
VVSTAGPLPLCTLRISQLDIRLGLQPEAGSDRDRTPDRRVDRVLATHYVTYNVCLLSFFFFRRKCNTKRQRQTPLLSLMMRAMTVAAPTGMQQQSPGNYVEVGLFFFATRSFNSVEEKRLLGAIKFTCPRLEWPCGYNDNGVLKVSTRPRKLLDINY